MTLKARTTQERYDGTSCDETEGRQRQTSSPADWRRCRSQGESEASRNEEVWIRGPAPGTTTMSCTKPVTLWKHTFSSLTLSQSSFKACLIAGSTFVWYFSRYDSSKFLNSFPSDITVPSLVSSFITSVWRSAMTSRSSSTDYWLEKTWGFWAALKYVTCLLLQWRNRFAKSLCKLSKSVVCIPEGTILYNSFSHADKSVLSIIHLSTQQKRQHTRRGR